MRFFEKKADGAISLLPGNTIGKNEIREATRILTQYKQGKANLEKRIVENEQWWKMQHWQLMGKRNANDPEPTSGWLFNSIANKHADAMDNYPEASVLPREKGDISHARALSAILPVILERNDFEKIWSDVWWYKLKTGTGCYGVFWNTTLSDGAGDVDIRQLDILNLFWESGVKDIQKSRNIFSVELVDNDILEERYSSLKGKIRGFDINIAEYLYDDCVDTSNKSPVVDWYYKKSINGKTVVHYCKYVGDTVLYASENDPYYSKRGYYDHGMYPFVFDTLFVEEGTPCGFGFIDVMKDTQMYIDKLNQIIIKNALQCGKRRFFISDNTGINEQEFADWSKEFVHVAGNIDERSIKEITVSQLDAVVVNQLSQKINELKEISGNRDVMQGGTASGVTAASAIAALQETGNKLSRDMIKGSYRAFKSINYLIIELIRQFYNDSRNFRIIGRDGAIDFMEFSNFDISSGSNVFTNKKPMFDIEVKVQKSSPFSKTAQNELAKELYNAGIFNPEMSESALICLEMMDFEGKGTIMNMVSKNAYLKKQLEQNSEQMEKMKQLIENAYKNVQPNINSARDNSKTYAQNADDALKKAVKSQNMGEPILKSARKNMLKG